MIVLNKLKSIFSGSNGDDKASGRDLLRERLQNADDLRDFHLENISSKDVADKIEPQFQSVSSEVHKNLVLAEEKLAGMLSEDDNETRNADGFGHDTNMQASWTDAVSLELSEDETED